MGILETMQEQIAALTDRVTTLENTPASTTPAPAGQIVGNRLEIFGHGQTHPDNLPPNPSETSAAQGFVKEGSQ